MSTPASTQPAQSDAVSESSAQPSVTAETSAAASRRTMRMRVIALSAALAGIVIGGAIQYVLGSALDSTGWFGTTIDAVEKEQDQNFKDIRAKLDALAKAPAGSPQAAQLQKDIGSLVGQQETLTGRTHSEIKSLQDEVTTLRADALKNSRTVTGADFWLASNESVTLVDRSNVLSLTAVHYGGSLVDMNFSGKPQRLKPGDFFEFETGESKCKVFYKVAHAREDGRYGFDLVCTAKQAH